MALMMLLPSAVLADEHRVALGVPQAIRDMIGRTPRLSSTISWGTAEIDVDDGLGVIPREGRLTPAAASAVPGFVLMAYEGIVREAAPVVHDENGFSFRAGSHGRPGDSGIPRPTIYLIPAPGPPWGVFPVTRPDELAIVRREQVNGRDVLVVSDGSSIEVNNEMFEGKLDARRTVRAGRVLVGGWSADRTLKAPAEFIVVMLGQEVLAVIRPGVSRPDVASILGCGACLKSGFSLLVSQSAMGGSPATAIRVFAVIGLHAIELTAP